MISRISEVIYGNQKENASPNAQNINVFMTPLMRLVALFIDKNGVHWIPLFTIFMPPANSNKPKTPRQTSDCNLNASLDVVVVVVVVTD